MNKDFVSARAAHPSQARNFPLWENELADDFDRYADEAIELTRSAPRMPRPAHPVYDTIIAALAGCVVGLVLGIALFIVEGGAA